MPWTFNHCFQVPALAQLFLIWGHYIHFRKFEEHFIILKSKRQESEGSFVAMEVETRWTGSGTCTSGFIVSVESADSTGIIKN